MTKITLTLMSLLIFSPFINAKDYATSPFSAVDALFAGMSNRDHDAMRKAVTDDFVLLEHGEIWSIEDLVNGVKPEDKYTRTNHFSHINTDNHGDVALINYWNKANISGEQGDFELIWLESVVVVKEGKQWRLSQMHSTRLAPDKKPENVTFKQQ